MKMTRGHQQTPNSSGLRLLPVFFCCSLVLALGMAAMPVSDWGADDGLALRPPMGWNSWNHYRLNVSDVLIRKQAEAIVKSGMKAAGYEYVVIDGGWEGYHDAQGLFRPNKLKFPDMKALCDYIHGLGLKVGIHTTPGPVTCSGREGSYGFEEQDAQTFARWGIDLIKYRAAYNRGIREARVELREDPIRLQGCGHCGGARQWPLHSKCK